MNNPSHLTSLRTSIVDESRRGAVKTALTVLVPVVFMVITPLALHRTNSQERDRVHERRTERAATHLSDRISAYVEVLYGVRSAFVVDPDLTHDGFHAVVEQLAVDERQPGVKAISVARLIRTDGLDEWERTIDGLVGDSDLEYPTFEVYPSPDGELALPIVFMEPQAGNERALGFDLLSESNRRNAAVGARDTGSASTTAPITLVQDTSTQRAVQMMLPMYDAGAPTGDVDQRRTAFAGVVLASFRMGDLVSAAIGDDNAGAVAVIDVETGEHLFVGDALTDVDLDDPSPTRTTVLDVPGRQWRLVVDDPTPPLSGVSRHLPLAALLGEAVVVALVVALVISLRSSSARAIKLAAEMTDGLEALTETAAQGIISVDEQGRIAAWNSGADRIFESRSGAMIGRPIDELFPQGLAGGRPSAHPGERADHTITSRTITSQTVTSQLVTARRSSGDEFTAELTVSEWSVRGRRHLTYFVTDVTERVRHEQRLAETTELLQGVLDSATELSIIATDHRGWIEVMNAGAERMLGYGPGELIGRRIDEIHDDDELIRRSAEMGVTPPGRAVLGNAGREGRPHSAEWTYVRKDGSHVPVELTITPRLDEGGELTGYIGVAIDVTERREADERQRLLLEQEREMVDKLRDIDQRRNDFVSTMSHELRTPLTSIIGYTEMLLDEDAPPLPGRCGQMVDTIGRNAERLLLQVEDLLALSQIESGSLHSTRTTCDLADQTWACADAVAPMADANRVILQVETAGVSAVLGSPSELERVVLNLLSNAVKFSRPGGTVRVRTHEIDGEVELLVIDHGIGIPADELPQLFSRFFRSRTAEEHAIHGTGLGLSIVQTIVARHGGTIEVDSVEGVGTTFALRFPAASAGHVHRPTIPHPPTAGTAPGHERREELV